MSKCHIMRVKIMEIHGSFSMNHLFYGGLQILYLGNCSDFCSQKSHFLHSTYLGSSTETCCFLFSIVYTILPGQHLTTTLTLLAILYPHSTTKPTLVESDEWEDNQQ